MPGYCAAVGLQCKAAWEESGDTCTVKSNEKCDTKIASSDALCECDGGTAARRCPNDVAGAVASPTTDSGTVATRASLCVDVRTCRLHPFLL